MQEACFLIAGGMFSYCRRHVLVTLCALMTNRRTGWIHWTQNGLLWMLILIIRYIYNICMYMSRYIPVHYMYRTEGQAVQYKYRLHEAKRDCTPNEWSPSSEIYVMYNIRENSGYFNFSAVVVYNVNLNNFVKKKFMFFITISHSPLMIIWKPNLFLDTNPFFKSSIFLST